MKKILIQFFIVIIGILLSVIVYNGVEKYFYRNFLEKENYKYIAYYDNLIVSSNPYIINNIDETTTTMPTTTTSTTTIPITTKTTIKTTDVTTTKPMLETTTLKVTEKLEEQSIINDDIVDNGERVLDDMTLMELTEKLNKSLNSTLSNTGHYFANYYVKTGLDPYLAVAIVLHETGCKWTCSKLVRECNNIGGIKGDPGCNGGSYKKFNTLDEGINGYLDLLYNNYYSKGLTTPELINPKYAASTTWSEKINNYILEIKSK